MAALEPNIRDVVFVHLPKTAGTSIRNMLVKAYPDSVKLFDYGPDGARMSGSFLDVHALDIRTQQAVVDLRCRLPRGQAVLVSTHSALNLYNAAFHPASVVTFLRDPVERVVSAYRHYLRHLNYAGSFEDFYRSPEHINVQSRSLWGVDLRNAGFIGLSSAMPDMIRALSRHLGVELEVRHDNAAGRRHPVTMDAQTRSRILELNDDDRRLYAYVEEHLDYFTDYRGRPETRPMPGKGRVYRTGESSFGGWALAFDPGQLAQVEARVGETVVSRVYADQFLPWLKKVVPHGVGGFEASIPAELLATGAPVRFVLRGTQRDLEGSPVGPYARPTGQGS